MSDVWMGHLQVDTKQPHIQLGKSCRHLCRTILLTVPSNVKSNLSELGVLVGFSDRNLGGRADAQITLRDVSPMSRHLTSW